MADKTEKVQQNTATRPDGMVMQIVTSLLCIGTGALLLFVPGVNMLYLTYCFCSALIVVGVVLIISYFVSEAYRKLNDYRFAIGVLLIILGCVELLRARILAEEIMFITGLVTLILAVIIMQSAVQMRILKSGAWTVQLLFTIVSLIGAVFVLIEFKPVMSRYPSFPYLVMVVTGSLCLISLVIEAIVLWAVRRKGASDVKEEATEDKTENTVSEEPGELLNENKKEPADEDTADPEIPSEEKDQS